MANLVEFLVKLKDMASGPLQKLGSTGQSSFAKIEASVTKLQGKFNTLGMNISQIDAKLESLRKTRSISFDNSQIKRINKEIDALQSKKDRLEGSKSRGGILATGLMFGGLALATAGLGAMLKGGMDRQMASTSFEVLAGKTQGDALHKNLMKFATDTIYGNEVFGEAKTMLGFGVAAKNIMPALNMLGDVAMGDVEHMKSLSLVFAQTASAGKLTGQDLLQYVNAGFNPLQALSEKTGKSMAVLRKEMEKGKISFTDVGRAFEYATGPLGRFHDGMKKMGETPTGKWLAFKGALDTLAGTLGLKLLPLLGQAADFLNILINDTPQLIGIAYAIGTMTAAWGLYTIATNWAAISAGALEIVAAWPIAALGAVAYAIATMSELTGDYGKDMDTIKSKTKDTTDDIQASWNPLSHFFETLRFTIKSLMLDIQDVFERMQKFNSAALASDPKGMWDALTGPTKASAKWEELQQVYQWQIGDHKIGAAPKLSAAAQKIADQHKSYSTGVIPGNTATGAYQFGGAAGAGEKLTGETGASITGGGVRNITINVGKFTDKVEVHSVNIKEGIHEVEELFRDMYLRITNSAASMAH